MLWFCVPSTTIFHVVYKISVVFLDGCSFLIDLPSPLLFRLDDVTENQKGKLFSEHDNLLVGPYFDSFRCQFPPFQSVDLL